MALSAIEVLLTGVEESLQCGICYEFLNVTMMTPCSHNYCSFCIRKYMTYKSECPKCFMETAEPSLVNNRVLDEVVTKFQELHVKLLDALKGLKNSIDGEHLISKRTSNVLKSPAIQPVKKFRKLCIEGTSSSSASGRASLRSSQRHKLKKTPILLMTSANTQDEVDTSQLCDITCNDDSSDFVDNHRAASQVSLGNKVPCPVCNVEVPQKSVDHHVEACLTRSEKREILRRTICKSTTRVHLPKLVYRLLSDKEIRKKLKEQGLSTVGNREALIKRHQAFKIAYNAECDSLRPRPVNEIVRQIQEQEKKLSNSQSAVQPVLPFNRKSQLSIIETEQKKYLTANKSHFNQLINNVRTKQKGKSNIVKKSVPLLSGSSSSSDTEPLEGMSSDSENSDIQVTQTTHAI